MYGLHVEKHFNIEEPYSHAHIQAGSAVVPWLAHLPSCPVFMCLNLTQAVRPTQPKMGAKKLAGK